jgi:hypothetical protein
VLTRACTSTSSGRAPSRLATTATPGTSRVLSERNASLGLATSRRPRVEHLEHAQLVRTAEAVLGRAQHAVVLVALAFE